MKTRLCLAVLFACCLMSLGAQELEETSSYNPINIPRSNQPAALHRTPPQYTFSISPTALMTSYYDYMIGSFNGSPLQFVPGYNTQEYFLTYQGKRSPSYMRRVFYGYIYNGSLIASTEISDQYYSITESYSALAFDPIVQKPLYAWQGNYDDDTPNEVVLVSDAFMEGISGLINSQEVIVNNPLSVTTDAGSTDNNEFLWPQIGVGPSPITGKRRVYVLCRNATVHASSSSENPLIAMADYNADDIEWGIPLTWTYRTVPELNDWNVDPSMWRRPFQTLICDESGNIYLCGYHTAAINSDSPPTLESDLDIFKCNNYGSGEWTRVTSLSNLPSWNPPVSATNPTGYFTHNGLPLADTELFWRINNSSHMNAVIDMHGKIHMPGLWSLTNSYGDYYPELQVMKEMIFDTVTNQFSIRDIYPQMNPVDSFNDSYQPWDLQAPFGSVDSWVTNGTDSAPAMQMTWNFPYWDATAHNNTMMYHYNNQRIAQNAEQNMQAVVWQNCTRAWMGPANGTNPWIHTPEIFISVSSDEGQSWSEPIILNNIETPQLVGIKPMWVYPASQIKYVGTQDGNKVGKLGLMFYNDYTWGANAISPPVHNNNDGGQVMFTELQIIFPGPTTQVVSDPIFQPAGGIYTSPRTVYIHSYTPGAQIRFTTDGSNPSNSSALYTGPINIASNSTVTLRAKAYHNGMTPSNIVNATYIITGTLPAPSFNPAPGSYETAQDVVISSIQGAQVYYTLDGTDPDESSLLYETPLHLAQSTTVKAIGYKENWIPSAISSAVYEISSATVPEQDAPPYTGIYSLYPNPFSDKINIRIGIKGVRQAYSFTVYNLRGERVYRETGQASGYMSISWDGRNQSGLRQTRGIYLVKLQSPSGTQTRKLILN